MVVSVDYVLMFCYSLPAKHTDDNGHKFNWSQTRCLGKTTTNRAREFKEAWHSLDKKNI